MTTPPGYYEPFRQQIAKEAIDWFVQLEDDISPAQRARLEPHFAQWLLRSPVHVREWLKLEKVSRHLKVARAPSMTPEREGADRAACERPDNVVRLAAAGRPIEILRHPRRRLPWRRCALAAAGALIALVAAVVLLKTWPLPEDIHTGIGEQRRVVLSDGSIVQLNTDTHVLIAVGRDERRLHIRHGEAQFNVAKDPLRPFIVTTPQATVRALGTVFNVRTAEGERTSVVVLAGRVEVSRAPPGRFSKIARSDLLDQIKLAAGEKVEVLADGDIVRDIGPTLDVVRAWPEHRLVVRDTPLAMLVAEMNRYYAQPLRIDDPRVAALRLSGTFDVRDRKSLLEFLANHRGVFSTQAPDGTIRLSAPE